MTKIVLILLGMSLLLINTSNAQTFGSSKIEMAQAVAVSNNGFALLGTAQNNAANFDLWTVFTDTSLNFLSEKRYGGLSKDIGAKIVVSTNNGFFLLGTTYSSELPNYNSGGDFLVVKTDATGNESWKKCFGGSKLDQAKSMVVTGDGGAILVGMTYSGDAPIINRFGQGDLLVQKMDDTGDLIWTKTFGGSKTDYPKDIIETSDGGFMIIGTTFSQDGSITANLGHSDMWVVKLDHTGNLQWSKSYGSNSFDYGHAIRAVVGGGYVLVGSTGIVDINAPEVIGRYNQELLAIKINEIGDVIWQKNYGQDRYDAGLAVYPMAIDGGFLITGYVETELSANPHTAYKNAWTLKLDADGNKSWETFTTGTINEYGVAIDAMPDKGIIAVIGDSDAPDGEYVTNGRKDIWIKKYVDLEIFSVSLGNDFGVCAGEKVVLDVTVSDCPNCTYQWEDQSVNPVREFTPTVTGVYSVVVTKSSGVQASDEISVTVFDVPTVSVEKTDPNISQSNGVITVSPVGGTAPYQIVWEHGSIEFELDSLPANNYQFILTDFNGCSTVQSVLLEEVVANYRIFSSTSVKIYPNPSSSSIRLESSEKIKSITIISTDGRIYPVTNPKNMEMAIDYLPAGIYLLKMEMSLGGVVSRKLLVY